MKVHIEVLGKLRFVKAIMDKTGVNLFQAKTTADKIIPCPSEKRSAVFDPTTYGWDKETFDSICKECEPDSIIYEWLE